MNKSADAFRTIGEVAEELDVPKHVLRFWEGKFPQIRPMKRGGGRRYYRPEDLALLRGIRHLLHAEGYTIKGVQKILREQGVEQVKVLARAAQSAAKRPASGKDAKAKPGKGAAAVAAAAPPPIETVTPASAPVAAVAVPGAAASRADVIRSVIRELEHCRALLIGNVIAEASAGAKRSRAGGRT
ncbi:MAG TPA: MerR family transcriptional regulator [Hyphomicrobium sp.]|nr:MerR family transcriptional regulator [Hyphomicrobium sp.]